MKKIMIAAVALSMFGSAAFAQAPTTTKAAPAKEAAKKEAVHAKHHHAAVKKVQKASDAKATTGKTVSAKGK